MIKNRNKLYIILVSILSVIIVGNFLMKLLHQSTDKNDLNESSKNMSTWLVYWDNNVNESVRELKELSGELEAVCVFEVYFDKDGEFVVPKEIDEINSRIETARLDTDTKKYLTIVNDMVTDEGIIIQKDSELLWHLIGNDESLNRHIENIISLVIQDGYDGIEIDYEAIKQDYDLWMRFLLFIEKLQNRAKEEKLTLRVVLEPGAPFHEFDFPLGIEYVIMCYNYKGGFSEPGPKAIPDFLNQIVRKTKNLPGDVIYAVAIGGFDWKSNEVVQSVNVSGAKQLEELYHVEPKRDEESQCLVFQYTDDDGYDHDVWYGDYETIRYWIACIERVGGTRYALWRIGG